MNSQLAQMTPSQRIQRRIWESGPLVIMIVLIAGGYLVFRAFVTAGDLTAVNLYALAVVAGVASFFSPCAFPLLPSYLSFYSMAAPGAKMGRPGRDPRLSLGLSAAGGVVTFSLLLGLIIALLGAGAAQGLAISGPTPNSFVRVFRGLVGLALLGLGVAQIAGWTFKARPAEALAYLTRPQRGGGRGPAATLYLYGLGYSAAGIGCTGPILAGLMISALTAEGFGSALGAFAIFSITMAVLMILVSGLVAGSQQALITRLKASTPKIARATSFVLILVGAFHLYAAADIGTFVRLLFP